jgi:hypothetical protein
MMANGASKRGADPSYKIKSPSLPKSIREGDKGDRLLKRETFPL